MQPGTSFLDKASRDESTDRLNVFRESGRSRIRAPLSSTISSGCDNASLPRRERHAGSESGDFVSRSLIVRQAPNLPLGSSPCRGKSLVAWRPSATISPGDTSV
jgi:hypothetical protein